MITLEWNADTNELRVRTSEDDVTLRVPVTYESKYRPVLAASVHQDERGFGIELVDSSLPGSEAWIVHPDITEEVANAITGFLRKEITHGLLRR